MKALHINFAHNTWQQRLATLPFWAWLVSGFAALALAMLVAQFWALDKQLQSLNNEMAFIQSRIDAREQAIRRRKPVAIAAEITRAANAVIEQLNTPWSQLLDALESTAAAATPFASQVALLELSPDAVKRRLRVKAEVRSTDDMMAYIHQLKQHGFFSQVTLIKHEVNEQDKNNPIRFEFEAFWQRTLP